jgi:GTPase SAR1 family protein
MQPERADVFPTTVLANIKWCDSLFVPLCDRLVAAVLALIKLDRDDQKINSSVIADTTQCLIWLGLNKENPKQSTLAVYKHYFEKDFLQATRTYYSAKLTSNVEQMARLTADEFRRCRAYLHHSTKPALAQTLDAVFGEKMPSCDAAEAFSYVRRVRLGDCDRLESGLFDQALRMCNADMTVYLASMQFGKRPPQPSLSSTAEQGWFSHIANYLVAGGTAIDSEVRSRVMPMLVPGHEVPFGLYEAVKLIVDARVKKLAIKSLLPLLCVLDELDRAAQSVEFDGPLSDDARASVRACLFGAMYKHIAESYKLPTNLDSEAALTTAQLFVGTMRQLEFFGGTSLEQDLAVAAVERAIDERMSEDPKMRAKYADRTLRDLKRRLPNLLLSTPEFATASLAKLDGEVEDKRVKIILVGDSGAGKTQIRRRLGGRHAFEGEHKSTDTAEVTSVEVTSLTLASATTWVECDEKDESQRLLLFKAAAAQALVDSAQFTNVNGVMHVRVEDAMCSQGQNDTRNLAVVSDLADLATPASSSVFAAPVAPSCAVASVVCDTVDATTALSTAALSMMPSGAADPGAHMLASTDTLDFEIMDERKVLSLWDFGGQAEYFVVHDLFLTRGALHVLVVDWTKGVEKAREAAQRWLDAIHAHADGALVLAVLPRCREAVDADDNGSDDKRALLDEVSLEIEQLADCALVRVDSATDFNYSALKRELLALVETRLGDSTTHGKVPLRGCACTTSFSDCALRRRSSGSRAWTFVPCYSCCSQRRWMMTMCCARLRT